MTENPDLEHKVQLIYVDECRTGTIEGFGDNENNSCIAISICVGYYEHEKAQQLKEKIEKVLEIEKRLDERIEYHKNALEQLKQNTNAFKNPDNLAFAIEYETMFVKILQSISGEKK